MTLYQDFERVCDIMVEYDAENSVTDFGAYARLYGVRSAEARKAGNALPGIRYGETLDEYLDIFPAGNEGPAPVLIFFHGGYWRASSAGDVNFVASGMIPHGFTTVLVNYALCPKVGLDEIVRQARAAVSWISRKAETYGIDASRIYVSGHSAGAHLAQCCVQTDWRDYGLPTDVIKGGLMISGLYDLRPIRYSKAQPFLQLTGDVIQRNSPLLHPQRADGPPLLLSAGSLETSEFRRQTAAFADHWKAAGNLVVHHNQPDRDHFSAALDLADPQSELVRQFLAMAAAN